MNDVLLCNYSYQLSQLYISLKQYYYVVTYTFDSVLHVRFRKNKNNLGTNVHINTIVQTYFLFFIMHVLD